VQGGVRGFDREFGVKGNPGGNDDKKKLKGKSGGAYWDKVLGYSLKRKKKSMLDGLEN